MKSLPMALLAFAALVSVSGAAMGGSHVNAGVARIEIEDQRTSECRTGAVAVCQVDVSNESDLSSTDIDASQNLSYIGVGASVDPIAPLGIDYKLDGEQGYVPNPVMPFLGETWMGSPFAPGIPGVFEMTFENQTINLYYNSVNLSNPHDPIYWHWLGEGFPDGQNRVGYDQLGPFNQLGMTDTDDAIRLELEYRCFGPLDTRECHQEMGNVSDWQANGTPDVRYGIDFHEVEAASNASLIRNFTYPMPAGPNDSVAYSPGPQGDLPRLPAPGQKAPGFAPHASVPLPRANVTASPPPAHSPPPKSVAVATSQTPMPEPTDTLAQLAAGTCGLILLAVLLYSRIRSRKEAIASAMRCRIYELVKANPGISPSVLAAELKLSRSGVVHHVRVLERMQMISQRTEGRKVYLTVGRVNLDPLSALIARRGAPSLILRILRDRHDGVEKADLVALTPEMPKRTRNHAIKQLLTQGLILIEDRGVLRLASTSTSRTSPPLPASGRASDR